MDEYDAAIAAGLSPTVALQPIDEAEFNVKTFAAAKTNPEADTTFKEL